MNIKEWLKSKKAKAFLVGLVVLICTQLCGLSEEQAAQIAQGVVGLVGTYVIGQGVADHGKGRTEAENGVP